mgnify:CR=1 FL=1
MSEIILNLSIKEIEKSYIKETFDRIFKEKPDVVKFYFGKNLIKEWKNPPYSQEKEIRAFLAKEFDWDF